MVVMAEPAAAQPPEIRSVVTDYETETMEIEGRLRFGTQLTVEIAGPPLRSSARQRSGLWFGCRWDNCDECQNDQSDESHRRVPARPVREGEHLDRTGLQLALDAPKVCGRSAAV